MGHAHSSEANEGIANDLRELFAKIAQGGKKIDQPALQAALEIKNDYFAHKIFSILDRSRSGFLDEATFLSAVRALIYGSLNDRLLFAFRLHDADSDGVLSKEDLTRVLSASRAENRMQFRTTQADQLLVSLLFNRTDIDRDGIVGFRDFKETIKKYPEVCKHFALSAVSWLRPREARRIVRSPDLGRIYRDLKQYIDNNHSLLVCLAIYFSFNAFLFGRAFRDYADGGVDFYVCVARGCGASLNFNGALILVPMLRHTITWVRKTFLRHYIPLDHNIAFHKLIAHVMLVLSIVHSAAHVLNYSKLDTPLYASLFLTPAGLTGFLLLAVFVAIAFCERKRSKHFELFYFSHLAFVVWFALALMHGPAFWQWVLLPTLAYCIERVVRLYRTQQPSHVFKAVPLPSGVTNLQLYRPPGFDYRPGDYVFVRVPAVSRFEWHPFTISSCPEEPGGLSVHIRNSGDWTDAVHQHFRRKASDSSASKDGVYLDGPYGAPSSHIFESKIAILIGAGIGVTPFASILQSILYRHTHRESGEPALQKVHFYWLNRDQQAFEWFMELLLQLERQNTGQLLDINIYMTGAHADMKSSTLSIAMDMLYQRLNFDLLTGLKSRTRMGHPDWEEIFGRFARRYRNERVDAYFCGPPGLSAKLKQIAQKNGFHYRKENF